GGGERAHLGGVPLPLLNPRGHGARAAGCRVCGRQGHAACQQDGAALSSRSVHRRSFNPSIIVRPECVALEALTMNGKTIVIALVLALAVASGVAISAQDRYTLKLPNGVPFSDFK